MSRHTLGRRLRRSAIGSIALAVALMFVFSSLFEAWSGRRQALEEARSVSAVLARNLQGALAFAERTSAAGTIASVAAVPAIEHATLYLADGTLFAEYLHAPADGRAAHAPHGHPGAQGEQLAAGLGGRHQVEADPAADRQARPSGVEAPHATRCPAKIALLHGLPISAQTDSVPRELADSYSMQQSAAVQKVASVPWLAYPDVAISKRWCRSHDPHRRSCQTAAENRGHLRRENHRTRPSGPRDRTDSATAAGVAFDQPIDSKTVANSVHRQAIAKVPWRWFGSAHRPSSVVHSNPVWARSEALRKEPPRCGGSCPLAHSPAYAATQADAV